MVLEIAGGLFGQSDVRETAGVEPVPTIANFTDAQHNHSSASEGGSVTGSHTNLADIGTHTHAEIDSHLDGTDQTEVRAILAHTANDAYETIYTVTAGKTLFITDIFVTNVDDLTVAGYELATGAGASEVDFLVLVSPKDTTQHYTLLTPIKITAETRISVGGNPGAANQVFFTIVGYEK